MEEAHVQLLFSFLEKEKVRIQNSKKKGSSSDSGSKEEDFLLREEVRARVGCSPAPRRKSASLSLCWDHRKLVLRVSPTNTWP